MQNDKKSLLKYISLETLLFSGLFLVSIFFFALIAHEVVGEHEDWFDTKAFVFLKSHSSPAVINFFHIVTFFGSSWFLLAAYSILVCFLILKRRMRDAVNTAITGVSSSILLHSFKYIFARHRPDLPLFETLTNYSFPSGHALSSFIFCCVLIVLIWENERLKRWRWPLSVLLILFSLLIGISRIVLRYHYASDVVAGFCLGFAWVLLSFWLQKRIFKKPPIIEQ